MNFLFKSSSSPVTNPRRTSTASPSAPPMEYDDLPIAVATPVPLPSSPMAVSDSNRNEEIIPPSSLLLSQQPDTTTTTIDRSTNARDGTLSISINTTTHYPNGHRERKIEYYSIPRNMVRKISAALDNGLMPSASYMVRMEQQSLPPGTVDLPARHPTTTAAAAATTTTSVGTTTIIPSYHHGHGRRACGICWCSACTICVGVSFIVVVVAVVMFMIQPWSKSVHSTSFPSWHEENNDQNDNLDALTTLYPSISPP